MTTDANHEYPPRSKLRPRFSLLALLLLVTLVCVALAWWRFVKRERELLLANRDGVAQSVVGLNDEISRKMQEYLDITREMGRSDGAGDKVLEIDLKQIDRIASEIMQLERQQLERQLNGISDNDALIEQRIAQLRKQREELVERIQSHTRTSADLEMRARELERLQRLADELTIKLEYMDIEIEARGISPRQ
jgi:hypothetical protein